MTDEDSLRFFNDAQKNEKALLGAILLENRLMHFALDQLNANSFVIGKHRTIFAAMVELYKKEDEFSANSVVDELIQHLGSESVDVEYVRSLDQEVPLSLTIEKGDYIERFIFIVSTQAIQAAAFEEMNVDDVFKLAHEKLNYAKRLMRVAKEFKAFPQRIDPSVN